MNCRNLMALCLSVMALVPLPLHAGDDQDSLLLSDYEFLKSSDPWLTARNAAGLSRLSVAHLSDARIAVVHDWGHLADFYESPRAIGYGADVASFYRLSPATVLYGSIGYDNYSGWQMGGSVFIDPTRMPFDIVEDSLTNHGRKHRDTYRLTGAVGTEVGRGISIGAKVDYTAANYAKYKDLRHKNSLMDVVVTAGISVPVGRSLVAGADFYYRRNTETVRFSTYGSADKVYKSLVSYAAFYGQVEAFGETGYTDKSREMPFFSEQTGFEVQADWKLTGRISWFSDFSWRKRRGYYGKKSPYTVSLNEHEGNIYQYHGRLSLRSSRVLHRLDVNVETENLQNDGNTYREQTGENSSTYYEYYTPVKLSNKVWTMASVAYTGSWGLRQLTPEWTIAAAVCHQVTRQTAYVYPYYRRQELSSTRVSASAERSFFWPRSLFTSRLGLSYQQGSGDPYDDFVFAQPSDKQTQPPEMTAYLMRNYEYTTSRQWGLEATIRYSRSWAAVGLKPYAELHYQLRRASSVEWLKGSLRQQLVFAVGTTF